MALLLGGGLAHAHAEFEVGDPAANSLLTTLPAEVTLKFTEPVEVRFSLFKVYRLETDLEPGSHAEHDTMRLNGLAGALVSEVLPTRGDDDARADAGVVTEERTSAEVVLELKKDLPPGHYVVMWQALSVDTHTTQGFYVFNYAG